MVVSAVSGVEEVLDDFAEVMTGLLIDQYQRQVAELELTFAQAQVLRVLRRAPVTTGQLAEELQISAPAITQLTDRLCRKGYIERRAAADDRRCVIVALTDEGRELVDEFRRRRKEVLGGALAQLNEDERRRAVEVLEKMAEVMGEAAGATGGRANVSNSIAKRLKEH